MKHRLARSLASGVLLVLAACGPGREANVPASPSAKKPSMDLGIFAPVAGRIVYGNKHGMWAIDPNGPSDTVPGPRVAGDVVSTLAPLKVDGVPLGWSSDGTALLLKRSVGDRLSAHYLSILHADGSETRLNETMGVADAAISPDGTRVVFLGHLGWPGLFEIDAEGGQPVHLPIPYTVDVASAPTFSPDGSQIAFLAGNRNAQVWVANAAGTGARQILADEQLRDTTGLEWSPAGDRLAIGVGTHEPSGGSIYTFAPDGSDFTKVIVGGSAPVWSPDGSQIAYTIQCDEDPTYTCVQFDPKAGLDPPGLAIADADGSNIRAFGFADSGPWHPGPMTEETPPTPVAAPGPGEAFLRENGEVLDFTGPSPYTPGDLVAVNPETGEKRLVVGPLDDAFSARWSADGRWVAYEALGPDGDALWVVGATQKPRRIATGESAWIWSSTGAVLSVIRTEPSHRSYSGASLSTIDPATGRATDVGAIPDRIGDVTSTPVWSPDGTRFVFGARGGDIYDLDVRTGARSLLVGLPGRYLDSVDQIVWSPDGSHIAVMNDLEPGGGRLYVMNADGSNVRVVLDQNAETGVAWSPDGTHLAYPDRSGEIWVTSMDGSAPTRIGTLLSAPCSLVCQHDLVWSPDGSRIALRTSGDGSVDVSAINADGQGAAERIDELTYQSWGGGSYSCGCP